MDGMIEGSMEGLLGWRQGKESVLTYICSKVA